MDGMHVLDNQLSAATKDVKEAEKDLQWNSNTRDDSEVKNDKAELDRLVSEADNFIGSSNRNKRGIENWKKINEMTKMMKQAAGKLKKLVAKQEASQKTYITKDKEVLTNTQSLARTIIDTPDECFANKHLSEAKDLARLVLAAEQVDKHSVSDRENNHSGLEMNNALADFSGKGNGYYDKSAVLLYHYAQNVNYEYATADNFNKLAKGLNDSMKGLRVLPVVLEDAVKNLDKVATEKGKADSSDVTKLTRKANTYLDNLDKEARNITQWKDIDELTKQINEKAKELSEAK